MFHFQRMILYLSIGAMFDSIAYLMVMPTLVFLLTEQAEIADYSVISFLKENQNGAFLFEKINKDYFTIS